MKWQTVIIKIDHETGEILRNTNGYIKIKILTEVQITFKDYNNAKRTITYHYKRDPQGRIEFRTEWDEWQDSQP